MHVSPQLHCLSRAVLMLVLGTALSVLPTFTVEGELSAQTPPTDREPLPKIRISEDGRRFVAGEQTPFKLWGFNYDHDEQGRLIEDYWHDEWETVVKDFRNMRLHGANVVRVHLQLGRFMRTPQEADPQNLARLEQLIQVAEETGLYLNLTGLGCYHKQDLPDWYDPLSESERWDVQARFWRAVARVGSQSSAVFCYDLMNEPILPGNEPATEWLGGELGGKFFVQRLTLELDGRSRQEVAAAWVQKLTAAIREVDQETLLTVGVIPWALTFKGAKPLFYAPEVGEPLDFVSVHFYPRKDEVDAALTALKVYDIGKPLVIEELFPLKAGIPQTAEFLQRSAEMTDGVISFYWGKTIEEYKTGTDLKSAIMAEWLTWFHEHAPSKK